MFLVGLQGEFEIVTVATTFNYTYAVSNGFHGLFFQQWLTSQKLIEGLISLIDPEVDEDVSFQHTIWIVIVCPAHSRSRVDTDWMLCTYYYMRKEIIQQ